LLLSFIIEILRALKLVVFLLVVNLPSKFKIN
jgi:hypothetical protein